MRLNLELDFGIEPKALLKKRKRRTWTLSRGFIIGLEDMTPNPFDFNQVILKLICFKTVRNSWRLNAEYSRNNNPRMGSKFVDIRCIFTDIRWKTCLRRDSLHKRCYIGLGCVVVCLQHGRVWNCGCWHKDGRISWEERRHRPVVPKTLGIVRTVLVHITLALAHLLAFCTEVKKGGLDVEHVHGPTSDLSSLCWSKCIDYSPSRMK